VRLLSTRYIYSLSTVQCSATNNEPLFELDLCEMPCMLQLVTVVPGRLGERSGHLRRLEERTYSRPEKGNGPGRHTQTRESDKPVLPLAQRLSFSRHPRLDPRWSKSALPIY
jgi:hypothetical protein